MIHLNKLELTRLIEKDGLLPTSIRGRNPKRYRIARLAVVLIPSEIVDEATLREFISKKSYELVKRRILTCVVFSISWAVALVSSIFATHALSKFQIAGHPQSALVDNIILILIILISSIAIFGLTWILAVRSAKKQARKISSEKSSE